MLARAIILLYVIEGTHIRSLATIEELLLFEKNEGISSYHRDGILQIGAR